MQSKISYPMNTSLKVIITLLLTALVLSLAAAEPPPDTPPKMVEVIVQGEDVASAAAIVRSKGGEVIHELELINAVLARLPEPGMNKFERTPGIRGVFPNTPLQINQETITDLVPYESVWKYLDDGSNQGTAWRTLNFDDSDWASGPAELGYGDGNKATVISYGPDAGNKHITTYFRHTFHIPDASSISMMMMIEHDDGAVIYLNGTEVFRNNMPVGTITYNTYAATEVHYGNPWYGGMIDATLLVDGANTLAVEIHQASRTSPDIGFGLLLSASILIPTDSIYANLATASHLHDQSITGKEVTVAVLDTGYWSHPYLDKKDNGQVRILSQYNAITDQIETQTDDTDDSGHGAHVTSIIASRRRGHSGKFNGIAPDVNLVSVKAFDEDRRGAYSDVIRGLDWVVNKLPN